MAPFNIVNTLALIIAAVCAGLAFSSEGRIERGLFGGLAVFEFGLVFLN